MPPFLELLVPERDPLQMLLHGDLDRLTAEEVAALEARLSGDEAAAAELAGAQPPAPDAAWTTTPPVSADGWAEVWRAVTAAQASSRQVQQPTAGRMGRGGGWWRGLAIGAAAAGLTLALWQASPQARTAPQPWPVEWAQQLDVEEVESYGDTLPLIMAGGQHGVAGVWVLPSES